MVHAGTTPLVSASRPASRRSRSASYAARLPWAAIAAGIGGPGDLGNGRAAARHAGLCAAGSLSRGPDPGPGRAAAVARRPGHGRRDAGWPFARYFDGHRRRPGHGAVANPRAGGRAAAGRGAGASCLRHRAPARGLVRFRRDVETRHGGADHLLSRVDQPLRGSSAHRSRSHRSRPAERRQPCATRCC